jgi:hypothetical protein
MTTIGEERGLLKVGNMEACRSMYPFLSDRRGNAHTEEAMTRKRLLGTVETWAVIILGLRYHKRARLPEIDIGNYSTLYTL